MTFRLDRKARRYRAQATIALGVLLIVAGYLGGTGPLAAIGIVLVVVGVVVSTTLLLR